MPRQPQKHQVSPTIVTRTIQGKMKQLASWPTHMVSGRSHPPQIHLRMQDRPAILNAVENFFEARLRGNAPIALTDDGPAEADSILECSTVY